MVGGGGGARFFFFLVVDGSWLKGWLGVCGWLVLVLWVVLLTDGDALVGSGH